MSTQLTKLKIQRWLNRRSNSAVEQLEKILTRLAEWIQKLDAEQDAAHQAMTEETLKIQEAGALRIAALQRQIKEVESSTEASAKTVSEAYTKIIKEANEEAAKARKVHANFEKLTN